MTAYAALNRYMLLCREAAINDMQQAEPDMPFYWDRDGRAYVIMLYNLIHDDKDGRLTGPGTLRYCLLCVLNNRLPFSGRLRIRREAVKCELKYRVGNDARYFFGLHNHWLFMIPPEKSAKLFVRIPDW